MLLRSTTTGPSTRTGAHGTTTHQGRRSYYSRVKETVPPKRRDTDPNESRLTQSLSTQDPFSFFSFVPTSVLCHQRIPLLGRCSVQNVSDCRFWRAPTSNRMVCFRWCWRFLRAAGALFSSDRSVVTSPLNRNGVCHVDPMDGAMVFCEFPLAGVYLSVGWAFLPNKWRPFFFLRPPASLRHADPMVGVMVFEFHLAFVFGVFHHKNVFVVNCTSPG